MTKIFLFDVDKYVIRGDLYNFLYDNIKMLNSELYKRNIIVFYNKPKSVWMIMLLDTEKLITIQFISRF